MPNLTIYVPRELAEKVRAHKIPVSSACQAALARKVRVIERRAAEAERSAAKMREGDWAAHHSTDRPA